MAIVVTTYTDLVAAVNAPPADGIIQIAANIVFPEPLLIPAESRITIESIPTMTYTLNPILGTSPRSGAYPLINVQGQLTLQDIILDGTPLGSDDATKGVVTQVGSTLVINDGAIIQHFQPAIGDAGAGIDSSGIAHMCGGIVQYNRANTQGGGVQLRAGYFYMYGGSINNNFATTYGGGVNCTAGSTFYLNCGEIHDNHATLGGGAANVDINQGHTFVMNGGCIYNNTTDLTGGAFFIISNVTQLMAQFNGGRIFDNTAGQAGGAMSINPNNPNAWVDIDGCVSITGNSGLTTPGPTQGGGAIFVNTGVLYVNNGYIADNHISGENPYGEQIFAVTSGDAQLFIEGAPQPQNTTFGTAVDNPIILCPASIQACSSDDCIPTAIESEKIGSPRNPGLNEPITYTINSVVTLGGGVPFLTIVDQLPIWPGGVATLHTSFSPTATVVLADGTEVMAFASVLITTNPLTGQQTITFQVVDENDIPIVLPEGTQVTVNFQINQNAPCETALTNNATVFTSPCDTGIAITDTVAVVCPETPQIEAEKNVFPTTAQIGDTVAYTITVTNSGNVPTVGLTLRDTLPTGLTYVTGSETSSSGSITQIGTPPNLIFNLSDLQSGESTVITFQATVNDEATDPISPNEAEVDPGDGGDPVFPISPPITITPSPPEEDTLTKQSSPRHIKPGDEIKYTITYTNGNVIQDQLVITDYLPDEVFFNRGDLATVTINGNRAQIENTGTSTQIQFVISGPIPANSTIIITFLAYTCFPCGKLINIVTADNGNTHLVSQDTGVMAPKCRPKCCCIPCNCYYCCCCNACFRSCSSNSSTYCQSIDLTEDSALYSCW